MSFARGLGDSRYSATAPAARIASGYEEIRRSTRSDHVGHGTLACPRCDAPVSIAGAPRTPQERLGCPYCSHGGPLREFLSLKTPARPARVLVRVARGR